MIKTMNEWLPLPCGFQKTGLNTKATNPTEPESILSYAGPLHSFSRATFSLPSKIFPFWCLACPFLLQSLCCFTALFLVVRGPLLQIRLGHPWSPFYSTQEASWNGEPVAQVSRLYPLASTMNPLLNMRGLKWSCHIQEMGTDFFLNLPLGCSFVQLQGHQ